MRRLIPAHAGKTRALTLSSPLPQAHPRSRGENPSRRSSARWAAGSSPLTRGKRGPCGWPTRAARLIPAHAGKTNKCGARLSHTQAHPRSRGENALMSLGLWARSGSSPLTRGKQSGWIIVCHIFRLIPAHAGKTRTWGSRLRPGQAHPRSRGENAADLTFDERPGGSSPLTRGKLAIVAGLVTVGGLIPAHAGKTPFCSSVARAARAHPRSRGENADRW